MRESLGTGFIDDRGRVASGQRDHASQEPVGQHVAHLQGSHCPAVSIRANPAGLPEQLTLSSIMSVAFAFRKMCGFGLELAGFPLGMQDDLLLSEKDSDDPVIPVHSHFTAKQMIGYRVEGSIDFDVAIHGDRATAGTEETEAGVG